MKYTKIYIFILIIGVIFFFNMNYVDKNTEYVDDLENLSDPIQTETSGGFDLKMDGWNVDVNYIAEYSISGKVVDVQDYYGVSFNDKLSPVDLGITWGFLANDETLIWSSSGNRFLNWRGQIRDINILGGEERINCHFSNNHLIPCDRKVKKSIKSIKEDDYVKIDGYLVNIYATKSDGSYRYWNSSTTRTDSGDGACEVIYVKNVTWLKEK